MIGIGEIVEKIFIGIPILNRLDLLTKCLDALDYPAEIAIINNNSIDPDFKVELDVLAGKRGLTVLHQPRNLGVPASWNLIVRTGFAKGYEWVFVGSNDTFLRPGSLKAALDYKKEEDGGTWHLCGYNFFLLRKKTIEQVGWFDENFYPAYKEDQDYHYRCMLAGLHMIHIPDTGGEHVGSATIRSNPDYVAANNETHHVWNNRYYQLKWGGDWRNERFQNPYNNPEHDYRWWPDPGDSIAIRDWDKKYRQNSNGSAAFEQQSMCQEREAMYYSACQNSSDIFEHLPALRYYGSLCTHITELVRSHVSTVAFLAAQPSQLITYGAGSPDLESLHRIKGQTQFTFLDRNVLDIVIDPTDLLFIDTFHTYNQLRNELALHHEKVARFILVHDTAIFGYRNEIEDGSQKRGIIPALQEFLSRNPKWKIDQLYWNCNGLAVLKKAVLG